MTFRPGRSGLRSAVCLGYSPTAQFCDECQAETTTDGTGWIFNSGFVLGASLLGQPSVVQDATRSGSASGFTWSCPCRGTVIACFFDVAFLLTRYRSEFAMLEIPAVVQRLVFPAVVAIGHLLGKYRRLADAPEPVQTRR